MKSCREAQSDMDRVDQLQYLSHRPIQGSGCLESGRLKSLTTQPAAGGDGAGGDGADGDAAERRVHVGYLGLRFLLVVLGKFREQASLSLTGSASDRTGVLA